MMTFLRWVLGIMLGLGLAYVSPGSALAEEEYRPSLSEAVLFGIRPIQELEPDRYPEQDRPCIRAYLAAVPPASFLRTFRPPSGPEDAVSVRRKNMAEQIVVILGENAREEGARFASAVPLSAEWEGMSEGPVDEANFVDNWLDKRPGTSGPIAPFLYLFKAHRLRAGFEAARAGHEKGLWPILAEKYHNTIDRARASGNPLIFCIADNLEAQPYVYLKDQGRP